MQQDLRQSTFFCFRGTMMRLPLSILLCLGVLCTMLSCGSTRLRVIEEQAVSMPVQAEPISAAALTAELGVIAEQQLPGAFLVEIQAVFAGVQQINTQTGTIAYTYTVAAGEGLPRQVLMIVYDMADRAVVELVRKEQGGKAQEGAPLEMEHAVAQVLFSSLLEQIHQDERFARKLNNPKAKLTITYVEERIAIDVT